jgi:CRP/FNR family cyclic AMP-dependent transcriptional regulator
MGSQAELITELKKVPWFGELKRDHLKLMSAIACLRRFKAGVTIFREGDKEDFLYVVLEGRIALDMYVPSRGKVLIYTAEQWDVFGWSSVTPTVHQRTAGAMAVLDSLVACIEAEKLRQLCEQDHDLGYLFMRRMADIVASRLMVTRLQLIDMFATPPETKNDD